MPKKDTSSKSAAAFLDMDGTLYPLPGGFSASPIPRRLRAAYVALLRTALPRAAAEAAYERMSADAGRVPISEAVASFLSYPGGRAAVLARVWGKVSTRGVVRAAHSAEARKAVARLRAAYGALYLVTGAPRCWAGKVLGILGLAGAFDGIFCLEDHGGQKSASFSGLLAKGYSPASCLSVGDQDETDLAPARALGMRALLVSGPSEILPNLFPMYRENRKVVIDTDPGVDDALAIMFALSYGLPVMALTTVFGNASIDDVTANAGEILDIMKSVIPVYPGASRPLSVEPLLAKSHGTGGFGGYRSGVLRAAQPRTAVDFLEETLEEGAPGSIDVVLLGPATNLALLAARRPDLMPKIASVTVLGGVLGRGNVTPYAEFNALNDPHALAAVLALPCPVTLIPIDACRKVTFTLDDLSKIADSGIAGPTREIAAAYISYYTKHHDYGGFLGGVMYDLLATGYLARPDLFSARRARVEVEVSDPVCLAQTREIPGAPNCSLVYDVDAPAIKDLFFRSVNSPKTA